MVHVVLMRTEELEEVQPCRQSSTPLYKVSFLLTFLLLVDLKLCISFPLVFSIFSISDLSNTPSAFGSKAQDVYKLGERGSIIVQGFCKRNDVGSQILGMVFLNKALIVEITFF